MKIFFFWSSLFSNFLAPTISKILRTLVYMSVVLELTQTRTYVFCNFTHVIACRGGVEDTRLEAKAKDTKKIRGQGQGQGQPFRGQTLSRPRTGMLEAKAKDQGHKAQVLSKKKKKVFTKIFQAISTKKRFPKNFSSAPQHFNIPKNSAVLEPRTGQFSRT